MLFEEIANKAFIQLIAKKLFMRADRLRKMVQFWNENDETRGRKSLATQERQMIYDEWAENSILSVDCRNGRQNINIGKKDFCVQRLRNTISTGRKEGQNRL